MRNGMETNCQFHISKFLDQVHGPIFLVKNETNQNLKITATFWWATMKFPRHIIYMILPLTR
jgi:hypothetical protein